MSRLTDLEAPPCTKADTSTCAGKDTPPCAMPADPYEIARRAQELALLRRQGRISRKRKARSGTHSLQLQPGSPSQLQGHRAENWAARHLQAHGLEILGSNLRCRFGEIDLLARKGRLLIFVEVRMRRNRQYGGAAASVNRQKQLRMIRSAHHFLPMLTARHFAGRTPPCRFDVVCIDGRTAQWITGAFLL